MVFLDKLRSSLDGVCVAGSLDLRTALLQQEKVHDSQPSNLDPGLVLDSTESIQGSDVWLIQPILVAATLLPSCTEL